MPQTFVAGDHIRVRRPFYWHHGIHLGDDQVIEFGGHWTRKAEARVREVSVAEFQDSGVAEVVSHARPPFLARWMPTEVSREECVERAQFLLQSAAPGRYNLVGHNCEHAATWCATGFPESHQVRIALYLNAGLGAATVLGVGFASRASRRPPRWMLAAMAIGCLVVASYHVHQGRFVRDVDRAWRARST